MNKLNELVDKVVKYAKNSDLYNYNDCYNSDEDAYNNFYEIMGKSTKGILSEIVEDVSMLALDNDLTDKEVRKQFNEAISLIVEINQYEHELNNEKIIEI